MEFPHLFYQLEQYCQLLTTWVSRIYQVYLFMKDLLAFQIADDFGKIKMYFYQIFQNDKSIMIWVKKHIWFLCMWFNPDLQHRLGDIINGIIIPVLSFFFFKIIFWCICEIQPSHIVSWNFHNLGSNHGYGCLNSFHLSQASLVYIW